MIPQTIPNPRIESSYRISVNDPGVFGAISLLSFLMHSYGIHWFRRDLRLAGNPALRWSSAEHSGRVLGLFCLDPKFLKRDDFSVNRFGFFLETLKALREELRQAGGDLLVLDEGPERAMEKAFSALKKAGAPLPATLSFNRDYEPFARARDARVSDWLKKNYGIPVHSERDHLLIEPEELVKDDGGFYQVYGAFAKKWFSLFHTASIQERVRAQEKGLTYLKHRVAGQETEKFFQLRWKDLLGSSASGMEDCLDAFIRDNRPGISVPLPPAGSLAGYEKLIDYVDRVDSYANTRDIPSHEQGTSGLSLFLKNGSVTSSQIIARMKLQGCQYKQGSGKSVFLQELVWREFYYSILYHCPRVENEAFLARYQKIEWENREDFFEAWKEGKTGYPIVDAGMRQLKKTGWMHNRVRMIVASFLTKDLLIDWKWGEKYFMNQLLDGDLAPNNGGWQWAASTGCDPQPYFRIFNPALQSKKFDPEGEYIRRYVPELSSVPNRAIHEPSEAIAHKCGYPKPIVQHASRRLKALQLYSKGRSG